MCARYRLKNSLRHMADRLGLTVEEFEEFTERPRLNVAISQRVPIVKYRDARHRLTTAEWGFLVPWNKSKRIFNAAGETLAIKPTFGDSFRNRRCLIPADGFYEWPGKQTTLIHFADDRPFCFAGLWHENAMTLITCAPNDFMRAIHHRMPVILREADFPVWLDPETSPTVLQSLLASREWDGMEAIPVENLAPDGAEPLGDTRGRP